MKTNYHFKKSIFSNTCKIYEGNKEIGFIKKDYFAQKTFAELNGKKFSFNEKGAFERSSKILNSLEKTIGEINYNIWEHKATINLADEKLSWQYINIWNTRWRIQNSTGKIIEFNNDGNIDTQQIENNEIEILSGLYLYKHYRKVTILVFAIIFTPIFLNSFLKLMN